METFVYRPKGVCSREMRFEMDGDIIRNVTIVGGCAGNLLGISRIIKDKKIRSTGCISWGSLWSEADILPGSDCGGAERVR